MTRASVYVLAIVAGLATAFALVSCGGEDAKLLPGNTAQEIDENLDSVQQLVDEGDCAAAEDAALQVSTQIEALSGIDPQLKQALRDGAARLNEVVDSCEEASEDTVEETTEPTTTEGDEEGSKKEKKEKKEGQDKPAEGDGTEPSEAETTKPPAEGESPPSNGVEETAPAEEGGQSGGIGPGSTTGSG